MIKFLISVVVVVGLCMGAYQIYEYWGQHKNADSTQQVYTPPTVAGDDLRGMPQNLEPIYQSSKQRGVAGLRDFLTIYGKSISDPRLGWIQLDYVILVAQNDPSEAKRVFNQVKNRIQPDSPVYARVQQLQKTYE